MKLLTLIACSLVAVSLSAETTNTSNSVATNAAAAAINQTFAAGDATTGRLFVQPVQPYSAPVLPYLGPWNTGSNIVDDLRLLPEIISLDQAKMMYNGGVSARINRMADGSLQFQECKLLTQLPNKYERKAFIFLQGNKKATTVDVVGKAVIEALNSGADAIYLMKKVTGTETSSTGFGIGIGYVSGGLNGAEMNQAQAASGGTGFNHATAKPVYTEGMVVLALKVIEPYTPPVPVVVPEPVKPAVLIPAPVPVKPINITVKETSLYFVNGKAELTPRGKELIKEVADSLKDKSDYRVIVSGYTSAVGSVLFNERLSNQRAIAVADALVAAGVPVNNISSIGKTANNHPDNRRVEIDVISAKNN